MVRLPTHARTENDRAKRKGQRKKLLLFDRGGGKDEAEIKEVSNFTQSKRGKVAQNSSHSLERTNLLSFSLCVVAPIQ